MIDKTKLTLIKGGIGDTDIRSFYEEAVDYILSFDWCNQVNDVWLASNWDSLIVVFLISIVPNKESGADDEVWVVVGDVPPAYIDIESAPVKEDVMSCYVEIMDNWVNDVLSGGNAEDCYPLDVPLTKEYANMLNTRLKLIKEYIL